MEVLEEIADCRKEKGKECAVCLFLHQKALECCLAVLKHPRDATRHHATRRDVNVDVNGNVTNVSHPK